MMRTLGVVILGAAVLAASLLLRASGAPAGAPAAPPYLTVFMLDGLSEPVFREELAAGRLPQMAALVREGVLVQDGISAFPSMTAYGFYPFLTGHDAAHSGGDAQQ